MVRVVRAGGHVAKQGNYYMRWLSLAALTVVLSGCAVPPAITIASLVVDVASYASTGKTVTDHGISMVLQKDCALLRGLEGEICLEPDPARTAREREARNLRYEYPGDTDHSKFVRAPVFSGRGYNIDSLTVAEVDASRTLSRITIVTSGTPMVIEQIKAQLERLVVVRKVNDLTLEGPHVERELALIKVAGSGEKRVESLRIADIFRARVVDSTNESFVFEMTGTTGKITAFIELMLPLGLVEISRTGIAAISRGKSRI